MLTPIVTDRNMALLPPDEDIVEFLRSTDFDLRLQTLNRLTIWTKHDPHWFSKFVKKGDLFKQLERLLMDDRWEVQHQCIKFLHDALPTFGNHESLQYMEWCITYLLPCVVTKLGSPKITIRRITNQMLTAYLKLEPGAFSVVQEVIVSFLLSDENNSRMKDEALKEIPNLMLAEYVDKNWKLLISGLAEMMLTVSPERCTNIARLLAHFNAYLGAEKLWKILSELTNEQYEICKKYEQMITETSEITKESLKSKEKVPSSIDVELRYRFGIIPVLTSTMLSNETDPTSRIVALEQVRDILNGITPEDVRKFATHLHSYFLTLGNVLDDLNFKVDALCLDVLCLTLEKVGPLLAPYVQQIIGLISKHFGNQKSTIKKKIMAICMTTMRHCSPKSVISYLCLYSEHQSSRIREEILNIMTAALLTFDSHSINLKAIADIVVPLLADQKRRVRLAAFELFAVFAHLSNDSTERLLKSVADLEQKVRAYGLLSAVKERILRKSLPKIRSDGLIEYAIPLGAGISMNRGGWKSDNLDYEWIMSGSSGSSSALSKTKWPSVRSMKFPFSTVPNENVQLLVNEKASWKGNFHAALNESQNGNVAENNATTTTTGRPSSDDCERYKINVNGIGTPGKCWDEQLLSHSLDRIRLEKLSISNNVHQIPYNSTSTVRKNENNSVNIEMEHNLQSFAKNGFAEMKCYNSNGNFLASNNFQNNKVVNPDELLIGPSESGNCYVGYAPSEPSTPTRSLLSLVRKSFSHQNLASTSKTATTSQRANALPQTNGKRNPSGKLKSASSMRSVISNTSSISSVSRRVKGFPSAETVLKNPEASLNDALQKLDAEDWNGKMCAIEVIVILAEMSPSVLVGNIHLVTMKLLNECKNLRSSVSRAAISSFGVLFKNLKTVMDSDIEKICSVLMQKAGDVSNAFIRDDATVALEEMVKHVSPGRSLNALVIAGAKSKNNTIRACCASLLVKLVERMGPLNVVNNAEFSRFVTSLLLFAGDANATVRRIGKYGIKLLSQNNELFDDAVRKSLKEGDRQNLREVLEAINRRGLEESLDSASISLGPISRSGSIRRFGSNGRDAPIPQGAQQDLLEIRSNLTASEWQRRIKGLKEFSEAVMKNDRTTISDMKVLSAFVGRTSDINFKVSVEAMETLITILPKLSRQFSKEASMKAVLYQLINSLMSHLASRSEGHRQHAKLCFEEITKYIDFIIQLPIPFHILTVAENVALLASFAAATRQANVKQRPFMLDTLGKLVESVYSIKPRQVEAAGLPVLWELLKTPPRSRSDPEVRNAIRHYAATLARCIGVKTLLEMSTFHISPNSNVRLSSARRSLQRWDSSFHLGNLLQLQRKSRLPDCEVPLPRVSRGSLFRMAPKSKYVIVQLASVISGTTRIWIRERAADKFRGIFYDPAVGREVLFEEKQKVKGKASLPDNVKKRFNLT
uniref:TOG domain-containing protein n=1 Tax=Setaria digitata TaxID=48799 RepID=A0A915PW11_9BILA